MRIPTSRAAADSVARRAPDSSHRAHCRPLDRWRVMNKTSTSFDRDALEWPLQCACVSFGQLFDDLESECWQEPA
jgi:hypothetical protein